MYCHTAWGSWDVEILECTALTAWGQWAVELLKCSATVLRGSGQWNSCHAPPHCSGAVGGASLQCIASTLGGSG